MNRSCAWKRKEAICNYIHVTLGGLCCGVCICVGKPSFPNGKYFELENHPSHMGNISFPMTLPLYRPRYSIILKHTHAFLFTSFRKGEKRKEWSWSISSITTQVYGINLVVKTIFILKTLYILFDLVILMNTF